jgi:hypothetical protein
MAPRSVLDHPRARASVLATILASAVVLSLAVGTNRTLVSAGRYVGGAPHAAALADEAMQRSVRAPAPAQAPAAPHAPQAVARVAPAPARAAAPARAPARAPAPVPVAHSNRLISADGTLNTGVGYYSDCTGRSELSHAFAAIYTCIGGRTYFIGHNPGVFTPLLHMGVGSIITWYDGHSNAHRLRIIGVRIWYRSANAPGLLGGAVAEFQTCISADGSVDRILDAAPA